MTLLLVTSVVVVDIFKGYAPTIRLEMLVIVVDNLAIMGDSARFIRIPAPPEWDILPGVTAVGGRMLPPCLAFLLIHSDHTQDFLRQSMIWGGSVEVTTAALAAPRLLRLRAVLGEWVA